MPSRRRVVVCLLAGCVLVIAGMLGVADRARRQADRARQAEVVMEHIRVMSERLDAITWRSLGTLNSSAPSGVVGQGVAAYRDLSISLRQLRRLGVPRERVAEIEQPLGATYGFGVNAIVISHTNPRLSQQMARTKFSPAIDRLNATIAEASKRQAASARSAMRQTTILSLGSLLGGLVTGAYRGMRGRGRRVSGRGELSGQNFAVNLSGSVSG